MDYDDGRYAPRAYCSAWNLTTSISHRRRPFSTSMSPISFRPDRSHPRSKEARRQATVCQHLCGRNSLLRREAPKKSVSVRQKTSCRDGRQPALERHETSICSTGSPHSCGRKPIVVRQKISSIWKKAPVTFGDQEYHHPQEILL